MRWIIFLTFAAGTLALSLSLSCVSHSFSNQRFLDSVGLPAPTLSISLSDPNQFSFAVVGDLHLAGQGNTILNEILTAAGQEGDSFAAFLGDIVDQGDRASVQMFRQTLTSAGWDQKTLSVIGNHDIFGDGWSAYKELNGPSHYVVNVGNTELIAIDTADGALCEDERQWLETQLASATASHIFILSHYLPTIPGIRTYLRFADESEAESLMKLASAHHVTGWLGGHYHSYVLGQVGGVSYLVAGGGGGTRMPPVLTNFYVQVQVSSQGVNYVMHPIPN